MKEDIKYLSISELNRIIKMKFDSSAFFNRVFIKGEISNFKVQMPSGHCYFTIKDEMSRISAVMFKGTRNKVGTNFKDGDMVNVVGKISVYEASGNYQIYIESMELNGSGDLYKKFLLLKEKLYKEGLFDESHKKQIPKYPKKIGVVTASTGAAIRDIITTIKRRYPLCEVILFPSLVQGVSAKEDIVKKIELANTFDIDTLIVGRGGGSIEDLWAYNEEIVARAIYNSKVPIISAVGHEIDWTIADFVADLRAPTPTGAAEMAVPTVIDINTLLNNYKIRLNKNIKNMINTKFIKWRSLKNSFVLKNPMSMYEIKEQKLDALLDKLNKDIKVILQNNEIKLNKIKMSYVIQNPMSLIDKKKNEYNLLINTLKLVNPLGILEKGYSLATINDKVIKSSNDVNIDDIINIKLHEGNIKAKVVEK